MMAPSDFFNKAALLAVLCLCHLLVSSSSAHDYSASTQRLFVFASTPTSSGGSTDDNGGRRQSSPAQRQPKYRREQEQCTARQPPVQYSTISKTRISSYDSNAGGKPSKEPYSLALRPLHMGGSNIEQHYSPFLSDRDESEADEMVAPNKATSSQQEPNNHLQQHSGPQTFGDLGELETAMNENQPTGSMVDTALNQQRRQGLPHAPVIYRYYSKSRSRTRASGSVPFILLGNIDHWRMTGEQLAARGFSVIACERGALDPNDEREAEDTKKQTKMQKTNSKDNNRHQDWVDNWWKTTDEEGANLVLNILQASRWTKAILVACDGEAVIAIQAAMRLAPKKIAGLVLCGDLEEVGLLLHQSHADLKSQGIFALDAFLSQLLPCPFAVAWDGAIPASMSGIQPPSEYDASTPAECLHGNRCFILGGGIAPHRHQPATFAWTLSRFVEDKVAPASSLPLPVKGTRRRKLWNQDRLRQALEAAEQEQQEGLRVPRLVSGFLSGDYFSMGSFVVYGRIAASFIMWGTLLKVGIFQYGNFLDGMVRMKSKYDMVSTLRQKIVGVISGMFHFGYVFRLLSRQSVADDVLDLDIMEPAQQIQERLGQEAKTENDEQAEESEEKNQDEAEIEEEQQPDEEVDDKNDVKEIPGRYFQPLFLLDSVTA